MGKVMDTIKSDAVEAAYRVGATQTVNGVRAAMVKALQAKGGDSQQVLMLTTVLDSEVGQALISTLLGHALPHVPGIKDNRHVPKISEEMRVNGYTGAGNLIADVIMDQLKPILANALSAIPDDETTNLRVSEHKDEHSEESVEKDERASNGKRRSASR